MTVLTGREEVFANAWRSVQGDDFASRMARQSLEATARETEGLRPLLEQLLTRNQVELDLRLDGDGVQGHMTNAAAFAELIRGISDSVKEISKASLGRSRLAKALLISAPMPGSVRVVLRAAPAKPDARRKSEPALIEDESVDSTSLETVANFLALAEESAESIDSPLDGFASELPAAAKAGVLKAARIIKKANWSVTGELRRPRHEPIPIGIGPSGASRLVSSLGDEEKVTDDSTLLGTIDGQRKSIATMWFNPEEGRSFEAAVVRPDLLDEVASYAAQGEQTIEATFAVTTRYPRGEGASPRHSYVLKSLKSIRE